MLKDVMPDPDTEIVLVLPVFVNCRNSTFSITIVISDRASERGGDSNAIIDTYSAAKKSVNVRC